MSVANINTVTDNLNSVNLDEDGKRDWCVEARENWFGDDDEEKCADGEIADPITLSCVQSKDVAGYPKGLSDGHCYDRNTIAQIIKTTNRSPLVPDHYFNRADRQQVFAQKEIAEIDFKGTEALYEKLLLKCKQTLQAKIDMNEPLSFLFFEYVWKKSKEDPQYSRRMSIQVVRDKRKHYGPHGHFHIGLHYMNNIYDDEYLHGSFFKVTHPIDQPDDLDDQLLLAWGLFIRTLQQKDNSWFSTFYLEV